MCRGGRDPAPDNPHSRYVSRRPFLNSELLAKSRAHGCPWVEPKNSASSGGRFAGDEVVAFAFGVRLERG